jgi:GNAT superfamily N-acetyltransferase
VTVVTLQTVSGAALADYIDDLARLRIAVFREYPYLYDGVPAYEREYLASYTASGAAMAVLVHDEGVVVGASTGVPLVHESDAFRQAFIAHDIDPTAVFYCGESVLLPRYRGQGLYKSFFDGRETYAVRHGFETICFCAVVRAPDDPRKPAAYKPLDAVWRHFGYTAIPDLTSTLTWKDIDAAAASGHEMMFWTKKLTVRA